MASVTPIAANTAAPSLESTATTRARDQQNQFLRLLVAQLRGQNPLDPMDGTQFITQLAQFSSLEQLTAMNSTLAEIKGMMMAPALTAVDTKGAFSQ